MTSPRKNGVVSSFPKTGVPCRRGNGGRSSRRVSGSEINTCSQVRVGHLKVGLPTTVAVARATFDTKSQNMPLMTPRAFDFDSDPHGGRRAARPVMHRASPHRVVSWRLHCRPGLWRCRLEEEAGDEGAALLVLALSTSACFCCLLCAAQQEKALC